MYIENETNVSTNNHFQKDLLEEFIIVDLFLL